MPPPTQLHDDNDDDDDETTNVYSHVTYGHTHIRAILFFHADSVRSRCVYAHFDRESIIIIN